MEWMLLIIPIITLLYNGVARLVNMGADMENLFMAVIYWTAVYGYWKLFAKSEPGCQRKENSCRKR